MALKRDLGVLDVFAVAAGAMISSGLFVLPAIAYTQVGPAIVLCYALAAVLLLPAVLTKCELTAAMPKAGSTFFHLDRSLGPAFGTVGGIANWAALSLKSAFALLGIGIVVAYAWPEVSEWHIKWVACGSCLAFAGLNILGVRHAGRVQIVLVAVLIGVLVAFAGTGVRDISWGHFRPLAPRGFLSVLGGTGLVFISYGGLTKASHLAEEVRRIRRDMLAGIGAAYVIVSVLYVAVVLVIVGVLPRDAAQWSLLPLSQAASLRWGKAGAVVLAAGALCAFLTTANAGILSASRGLMGMAEDGLVPSGLARVGRRGTPALAILLTSLFMVAAIMLLDLTLFAKAASAMLILLFVFEMLALVLMRESRIPTYQPVWRCPFYPWMQVAGVLCYLFLLVELGTVPLAVTCAMIGAGAVWYAFYAKVRVLRESALVHLAARLARADFRDDDLEAELARVARERSPVQQDRFDHLIEQCTVLDLQGPTSREEALRVVAEALGKELNRPAAGIYELLAKREDLSSTVVRPGLAIPHMILEGLDRFAIVLVRSREGLAFAEGQPPVHAVFVLAAAPEERTFYLQALMAIAEIAQEPEFDARWLASGSREALRELVLAAERRRIRPPSDAEV